MFVFGVLQVVFYRIRTEYGDLQSTSAYSIQMLENKDQKTPNPENFHGFCDDFFNLWQYFFVYENIYSGFRKNRKNLNIKSNEHCPVI